MSIISNRSSTAASLAIFMAQHLTTSKAFQSVDLEVKSEIEESPSFPLLTMPSSSDDKWPARVSLCCVFMVHSKYVQHTREHVQKGCVGSRLLN